MKPKASYAGSFDFAQDDSLKKLVKVKSMSESVYILGGGRTDFKRNLKKEGKTIRHIIIEAGKKAIEDAKIDPAEIQAGAVGNFNAGQFTKQLQLGAFIPEIDPKLRGIPTMHTEAACASGALSVLLGAEWIMGGFYDVGARGWRGTTENDVIARWVGCSRRGCRLSQRKTGVRRFHVPETLRAHRADLYREIRRDRSGPGSSRMEKLRACQVESARANARRRSHIRLRIASFR